MAEAPNPRAYYATLPGRRTARRLARVIAPTIATGGTTRLLAIGYPPAILAGLDPRRFERLALLLTSAPHRWPARGPNHAAAAAAHALPLQPSTFDQALLVHALEHAPDPARALAELWRVLAPAGTLVVAVPNRLGRWLARRSPFAAGRAYTEGELEAELAAAGFAVTSQTTALGQPIGRVRLALATKADGAAPTLVGLAEAAPAAVPVLAGAHA